MDTLRVDEALPLLPFVSCLATLVCGQDRTKSLRTTRVEIHRFPPNPLPVASVPP